MTKKVYAIGENNIVSITETKTVTEEIDTRRMETGIDMLDREISRLTALRDEKQAALDTINAEIEKLASEIIEETEKA